MARILSGKVGIVKPNWCEFQAVAGPALDPQRRMHCYYGLGMAVSLVQPHPEYKISA